MLRKVHESLAGKRVMIKVLFRRGLIEIPILANYSNYFFIWMQRQ